MSNQCVTCKHGHKKRADGQAVTAGTVWCTQRNLQMGALRQMPCFVSLPGTRSRHCMECKRAKIIPPTGESLRPGNIWCDKRHLEINKQRSMECFE